jgi:hypothetical protein
MPRNLNVIVCSWIRLQEYKLSEINKWKCIPCIWNEVKNFPRERNFVRKKLRNKIPKVCFYFCSMKWNSELFSLLGSGSERNIESLLLLCSGTEFRAFFYSAERFGTEFREFSVPRNSRNSVGTKPFVSSVFPKLFFCRKLPALPAGKLSTVEMPFARYWRK